LAELGPDGLYYPELAVEVPTLANSGLSQDGLTVTWHLRPNVLWSDDEPFTGGTVVIEEAIAVEEEGRVEMEGQQVTIIKRM
jgi:ABC-type oligopeptide transport system substrate-binding subunit